MTLRKVLQIISLVLLLYILADAFMHIDFAATKNNAYTSMQKMEVDSTQNIETVKQMAKDHLDTIRQQFKKNSSRSVTTFWLLTGLIIIQVFLFINKQPKRSTDNNGR